MQGASAFQKLLDEQRDQDIKVFVIWEPVLPTDLASPSTRTLARISDAKASQYWDKERLISRSLGETDNNSIVWDYVAVHQPGKLWDKAPPEPIYSSVPVVEVIDETREAIQKALQESRKIISEVMVRMNCCAVEESTSPNDSVVERSEPSHKVESESSIPACGNCLRQGRAVSRKTVMLMLKPDLLDQAMTGKFSFCSARDCPVVYFEDEGNRCFTVDDLRTRVGLKGKENPIPLCYCFGFDESHLREEIARTGETTIPEKISRLIREGLCACDTRNPSSLCCLGEVNNTAKRLFSQRSESA